MKPTASKRDEAFREFALTGNMWKLMIHVCLPLILFQCLSQLFRILDTMMASYIGSSTVTTVAYISQISMLLTALGGGLAVGASIKISEAFGAGQYELVRERVSTVFAMCAILGGSILIVLVPFAKQFLRLFNTPEALIEQGTTYFIIELVGLVVTFFNTVYISIERSRGNSKRIFWLNTSVAATKLVLTALFVFGWKPLGFGDPNINHLSLATLLANCIILVAAIIVLSDKESIFAFSIKDVTFKRDVVYPIIKLAFPVCVERAAFSMGKVLTNAMCADDSLDYHPDSIGAVSVSNQISSVASISQNAIQEGGSSIISQNIGGGRPERMVSAFKCMMAVDCIMAVIMAAVTLIFLQPLTMILAANKAEFAEMIAQVYKYEALAVLPLGIYTATVGLLHGLGKTKITLVMNVFRIFIFRVPVLWYLQNFTENGRTDGPNTIGFSLGLSNVLCGVLAAGIATVVVHNFCKEHHVKFFSRETGKQKQQ